LLLAGQKKRNQMSQKIRVFHIEDYKIMRDGIKHLLELDDEIEFVGEGKNGEELIDALSTTTIDVLILDIYLDGMEGLKTLNGFEICKLIKEQYPSIKILAHSVYDDADRVARIINAGALGFVSKKSGFDELLDAIKIVNSGQKYICNETSARLKNLNKFLAGIESTLRGKDEIFSQREREILELLAQGKSSRETGDMLFITERTVETHRKNMLEKSNVKNTVELIAFASTLGLLRK
jgi:DNA-binding NarL/FixJ family response regulator